MVTEEQQLNNKDPQGEFLEQFQNPVGSGAWILSREETNTQTITLVRNEKYHLKAGDGSPLYKVEKIKLLLFLDSNTAIFAVQKGYIDILDTSISSNYLALFEEDEDIFLARSAGTSVSCLVLNVNPSSPYDSGMKLLFGDREFRRAMALAIDQEELIEKVLNGAGDTAGAGLILKSSDLYNAASDILAGDMNEKIAEANAILDGMYPEKDGDGYRLKDGQRISFEVLATAGQQDLVAYLQRQFWRIGIEVSFRAGGSTPETTYIYQSDFDMTVQGVILSMSNADVMYRAHFVTTERSSNYGKYADEALTALIEEMRYTLDQDEKREMIGLLQTAVAEAYYKIPLYSQQTLSVARTDRFTGYVAASGQTVFNNETLKNLVKVV